MSSSPSDITFSWGKYDALWLLQEYVREFFASGDAASPRAVNQAKSLLLVKSNSDELHPVKIGGANLQIFFDYVLIDVLWIDPKFRNQGFGRKLVEKIEDHARELGVKRLLLSTYEHQNSIEFWRKIGCEEVGRVRDYPEGQHLIYFHKRLG